MIGVTHSHGLVVLDVVSGHSDSTEVEMAANAEVADDVVEDDVEA